MLIRVLGSIEVRSSPERAWARPPPQQRIVLALLVVQPGRTCRADRLAQALWGEEAPANARRLLQGLISRLRSLLDPADRDGSRLPAMTGGWRLDVGPEEIDAARFERLVREAHRRVEEGEAGTASGQLREAIGLWRGPPFGDLADRLPLKGKSARLQEELLGARELLLRLRLAAGELVEVTAELQELVIDHPFRERLWALLMEALYRADRQADALMAYQELRERLITELGTEPGPRLQQLHEAILRQELPTGPSGRRLAGGSSLPPAGPSFLLRRNSRLSAGVQTRGPDGRE